MLDQIISLVADVGLGAVAIALTKAVKADVEAIKALVTRLDIIIANHEKRLEKLENGG